MTTQPEIDVSELQATIEAEISKQFPISDEDDETVKFFERMDQEYVNSQYQRKMRLFEIIRECEEEIKQIDEMISMFNQNHNTSYGLTSA